MTATLLDHLDAPAEPDAIEAPTTPTICLPLVPVDWQAVQAVHGLCRRLSGLCATVGERAGRYQARAAAESYRARVARESLSQHTAELERRRAYAGRSLEADAAVIEAEQVLASVHEQISDHERAAAHARAEAQRAALEDLRWRQILAGCQAGRVLTRRVCGADDEFRQAFRSEISTALAAGLGLDA